MLRTASILPAPPRSSPSATVRAAASTACTCPSLCATHAGIAMRGCPAHSRIIRSDGTLMRFRSGVPVIRLKYTPDDELSLYHSIEVDEGTWLEVFGAGNEGSYEWALVSAERGVIRHSDCGYGCTDIALRDGLIDLYGLPNSPMSVVRLSGDRA